MNSISIKFSKIEPPDSGIDWTGIDWWLVEYEIEGISGSFRTALDASVSEKERLAYFYRRAVTEARLYKSKRAP